jgi:hypothetical protein
VHVLGGRLDEAAPTEQARLACDRAAIGEERARDVDEHDLAGATLERAEADQPVAAADVDDGLAAVQACVVEHAITYGGEFLEHARLVLGVTAGSTRADPLRPLISHCSARRISSCSGKRPASCFEKTRSPSRSTSNCPLAPGMSCAGIPFVFNSAARLAARSS